MKVTLDPVKRKTWEIQRYILGEMKIKNVTQKDIADELGITQPAVSYLLSDITSVSVPQLLVIFDLLQTPQEERGRLITLNDK